MGIYKQRSNKSRLAGKRGHRSCVEGRCMKCKKQVDIQKGKEIVMKNGMKAMKGECGKCGTKVFRILGKA